MKFANYDLAKEVKNNLDRMGFVRTTDIQYKTMNPILKGEDVLAIAQTGTGKTGAFSIPIIDQIHKMKSSRTSYGVKCLVLTPTRELAQQLGKVISKISKGTKANSYAIYGGVDQNPQKDQLEAGIDILIATPGRMFDLIAQGSLSIAKVSTLVLDEADHMLDLGFIKDIESIKKKLKHNHQTLFFSATINPEIKKLAYSQIKSSAMRIQVAPDKILSPNITHSVVKLEMDEKRTLLENFIREDLHKKVFIFVRTQVRVERLQKHLSKIDIPSYAIHGGMTQEERDNNLASFKKDKQSILIATDVSARGIDVQNVSHVINFDLPDDPENYVHRVGRTGRGNNKGDAVSFCSPEEKEKLVAVEEFLNMKIHETKVQEVFKNKVVETNVDDLNISEMLELEESLYAPKKKKNKKRK